MRLPRLASFRGWGLRSIAALGALAAVAACDSSRLSPVGGYCRGDRDCERGLRCVARECIGHPPPFDMSTADMTEMGAPDMAVDMGMEMTVDTGMEMAVDMGMDMPAPDM